MRWMSHGKGSPVFLFPGPSSTCEDYLSRLRFEGKELVYRMGDTRYESDFYNAWFLSPSAMLTQQMQDWLRHARLFERVVATSSYMDATHILEGTVTALYGDYRQEGGHKAVVGIQIVLIEDNLDAAGDCVST